MRLTMEMHLERRDGARAPWRHVGPVDYPNEDVLALKLLGAPSIYDPPAKLGYKVGRPRQLSPEVAAALDGGATAVARVCSVTLRSLLALDWTSGGQRTGWVSAESYRQYLAHGEPSTSASAVMGISALHIERDEMERRIREEDWNPTDIQAALIRDQFDEVNRQRGEKGPLDWSSRMIEAASFHTRFSWSTQLRHRFKHLYAVVQRMKNLGPPANVRLVYGFWRQP